MYFGQTPDFSLTSSSLPGWLDDLLKGVGVPTNTEIATAVAVATANPTYPNIQRVMAAYNAAGQNAPGPLINWLMSRMDAHTQGQLPPATGQAETNWWPLILIAGLVFLGRR